MTTTAPDLPLTITREVDYRLWVSNVPRMDGERIKPPPEGKARERALRAFGDRVAALGMTPKEVPSLESVEQPDVVSWWVVGTVYATRHALSRGTVES